MNSKLVWILGLCIGLLPGCAAEMLTAGDDLSAYEDSEEPAELSSVTQELAEPTDTVGELKAESLGCDGERQRIRVTVGKEKFKNWDKNKNFYLLFNFRASDGTFIYTSRLYLYQRDCKTNFAGRRVCEPFTTDEIYLNHQGPIHVLAYNYESRDISSIDVRTDQVGPRKEVIIPGANCKQEANAVRLRHKRSNQCLYAQNNNGATARHWQCWNDPNMAFALEPAGGGGYRLRHTQSGQCLYGSNQNGGTVNHWQCWNDPNMVFHLDQVASGEYRLRHALTNKCVYVHGGNGQTAHVWDCWNDPNMVFTLDN
jgi:hypothetical protein